MVQYADDAGLITSLATIEEVLGEQASEMGQDLIGYRNHVYPVVNLCLAIGIWTNKTFDYIAPSVALAREHLAARGLADWIPEIEAMIVDHHKVTPSRARSRTVGPLP
jgi:hypothetical protein